MGDTFAMDLAIAAALAVGLWVGANADVSALSVGAAVVAGLSLFGAFRLVDAIAGAAARAIRRRQSRHD